MLFTKVCHDKKLGAGETAFTEIFKETQPSQRTLLGSLTQKELLDALIADEPCIIEIPPSTMQFHFFFLGIPRIIKFIFCNRFICGDKGRTVLVKLCEEM